MQDEYEQALIDLRAGITPESFPSIFANKKLAVELEKRGEWHVQNPNLRAEEYLHSLHIELWEFVKGRTLLYLDTGYWVGMRQGLLDDRRDSHLRLFLRLVNLSREGVVICPTSDALFDELVRQNDRSTRAATAELMDQLSMGICLQNKTELIWTEIRRQIYRSIKPELREAWCEWIFTKIGLIHYPGLPHHDSYNEAENNYLRKSFIDHCWFAGLIKDMASASDHPEWGHVDNDQLADAHNQDFQYYRENKADRENIRGQEIGLEWQLKYNIEFEKIAGEILQLEPVACAAYMPNRDKQPDQNPEVLPQIQIKTTLSTFFATDHKKRMKATDLPDIEHASYALPYVDIFACDRRLAHAIKAGPHKLDSTYGTEVVGSVTELEAVLDDRFGSTGV
ncbi:MAG: hypothetical protein AB8F34_04855 [Akkermansiaceae bacterium]